MTHINILSCLQLPPWISSLPQNDPPESSHVLKMAISNLVDDYDNDVDDENYDVDDDNMDDDDDDHMDDNDMDDDDDDVDDESTTSS